MIICYLILDLIQKHFIRIVIIKVFYIIFTLIYIKTKKSFVEITWNIYQNI